MLLWLKNNLGILALAAAFIFGAAVNGWYRDSLENVQTLAEVERIHTEIARQGDIAKKWADSLDKLNKKKEAVTREVRTIVERPVYSALCIDADGVRLANAAKNGLDPGKPAAALPGATRSTVHDGGVHTPSTH